MSSKEKVLVTNAEAKSMLAVVESLGQRGIGIHACGTSRICPGYFSKYVTKRAIYKSPKESPDDFMEKMLELQRKYKYDAIIPIGDDEIEVLAKNIDTIKKDINLAIPEYDVFRIGRDKSKTMKAAKNAGIPCPNTWYPEDKEIDSIAKTVKYPVLIKPNVSAGARGITLVESKDRLVNEYIRVKNSYGECTIQEYIPKGGGQYKADFLMGKQGKVLAGVVYKKLRYYPVEGGSSTLVCTIDHPEIYASIVKLLRHIGWVGFVDFDFIQDPRDGIAKIIEINPRFPESLSVNLIAGIDFPYMLFKIATGYEVEAVEKYATGKYSRFLAGDILWFIKSRDRFRAKPNFFKFYSKDMRYYVESFKDPGPTLGYILENMSILFNPRRFKERYLRGFKIK